MRNTVEIRLKLLKMQGMGFSKRETVKHLQEMFGLSQSGAYYHFETKDKWISQYFDFKNKEDLQFNILNSLNQINREASFQYRHATDDNTKIGYLRTRLGALSKLAEYAGFNAENSTLNSDQTLRPNKKIIVKAWQPNSELDDSLRRENELRKWMDNNLTPEEQKTMDDASRIFIRYDIEQRKKEVEMSLH